MQSLSEDDMAAFKSLDGNNHNGGSFPDIKLFVMADDAEARLKQYCFEVSA